MCILYPTHEEIEDAYCLFEGILIKIASFQRDKDGIFLCEPSFIYGVANLIKETPYLEYCFRQKIQRVIENNAALGFKSNSCPLEIALKFVLTNAGSPY